MCDLCDTGKRFGVILFSPAGSFHQCAILIFSHMLLLPEEQTGEDWEHSKSDALFEWQH
jgi:hypothetical protein